MSKLKTKFVILCSLICNCLIADCLILDREYLKEIYGHKLENLKVLDLSNRNLNKIDSNAFKGLTKLEILDLSNNEIEEIQVGLFKELFILEKLNLSNNKIKKIVRKSFLGLVNLKTLCLDNNEIKRLFDGSFLGLSKLNLLKLNNNRLIEIYFKCFDDVENSIEVIQLFNNDLSITNFSSQLILSFYNSQTQLNSNDYEQEKMIEVGFLSNWNDFLNQFEFDFLFLDLIEIKAALKWVNKKLYI